MNTVRAFVDEAPYSAVGNGTTNDRAALQAALDAAAGGGHVYLRPAKVYAIDPAGGPLRIASNTTMHGRGSTLKRIGSNITTPMVQNRNFGTLGADSGIWIKELRLVGTGDTVGVSGQGHCIALFGAASVRLDDITTDKSNGDGVMWRRSDVQVRRLTVGGFGRNGMSPTSDLTDGPHLLYDVAITGDPLPNASPGVPIDIENDHAHETSHRIYRYVRARNITFVDFHTPDGGTFAHRAELVECSFTGGGLSGQAVRVLAPNATATGLTAQAFQVSPSTSYSDRQVTNVAGVVGV